MPFDYYGIDNGADYQNVSWRRGRGYDPQELSQLVTGDHALARRIIANALQTVPNPETMRALGFCVSVAHASLMAEQLNAANPSPWPFGPTPRPKSGYC